jgi:pyruvate-ferredoxin/flavodoxin oxidoreductase
MSLRQSGIAMLVSDCVQEVIDIGLVAHLSSMKSRLPFLHFFDGYRTSSEISNVHLIPYEDI